MAEDATNNIFVDRRITIAESILYIFGISAFVVPWILGVVLAKGFWSTFFASWFFPYAWYLTAERIAEIAHLIPSTC